MPVKNVVRGQRVSTKQLGTAKELRGEMTPAETTLLSVKHICVRLVSESFDLQIRMLRSI